MARVFIGSLLSRNCIRLVWWYNFNVPRVIESARRLRGSFKNALRRELTPQILGGCYEGLSEIRRSNAMPLFLHFDKGLTFIKTDYHDSHFCRFPSLRTNRSAIFHWNTQKYSRRKNKRIRAKGKNLSGLWTFWSNFCFRLLSPVSFERCLHKWWVRSSYRSQNSINLLNPSTILLEKLSFSVIF